MLVVHLRVRKLTFYLSNMGIFCLYEQSQVGDVIMPRCGCRCDIAEFDEKLYTRAHFTSLEAISCIQDDLISRRNSRVPTIIWDLCWTMRCLQNPIDWRRFKDFYNSIHTIPTIIQPFIIKWTVTLPNIPRAQSGKRKQFLENSSPCFLFPERSECSKGPSRKYIDHARARGGVVT